MVELPTTCQWVIVGDFNMAELGYDKSNPCGKMIPTSERLLFNALRTHLNVEEGPKSNGSLRFSWDNVRSDGSHILVRLDRAYVFKVSDS